MLTPEDVLRVAIIRDPWKQGSINLNPAVPVITTQGKRVLVEKVFLSGKKCSVHLLGTTTNLAFEEIRELAPDFPRRHEL